jgi:lipopolysaccharide biosynthesis regulator YciM
VRRFYELDVVGAERLFASALVADSSFAMAAYYWSLTAPDPRAAAERIDRAMRLSAKASDRERLIIRTDVALRYSSPELAAYADTLEVRYPDEVKAQVYRGDALALADEYLAAVPHLQRAIAMDSLALAHDVAGKVACAGCDAFSQLLFAYWAADSIEAAEREARRWVRLQPKSAVARLSLASLLGARGRMDDGLAELRAAQSQDPSVAAATPAALAVQWLRGGDYARADNALRALIDAGTPSAVPEGHWYLAISEREQGRLEAALADAIRYRATLREGFTVPTAVSASALLQAQLLRELGRSQQAATLFDSVGRWRLPQIAASMYARNRAWSLAHEAGALAAAGETSRLAAIVDTVQLYGSKSALGRDQRLHHYVRGLLFVARGQDDAAIGEFQSSIRSRTLGYTRASFELSAALLRRHRAKEAVAMLQPALRGEVEASNLYVSRTELHELLAKAWDEAGRADSASAHYAIVAKTWAAGDAPFRARADAARARSAALASR